MNFKNLIQASAQIVQITELQKGDTFKMITEGYSNPELKYGVVTEIMNDGNKGFVTAIVMKADYRTISKEVKLLSEKEMENTAIFPTTWEEIKLAMQDSIEGMERSIKDSKEDLRKKEEGLTFAQNILSGAFLPETQEPKFQILPSNSQE